MKTLYIIPGYGESEKMRKYKHLKTVFAKCGYYAVFLTVDWKADASIRAVATTVNKELKSYGDTKDTLLLGFSFGACIVALVSKKHTFKQVLFCSISPYFKDDLSLWSLKTLQKIKKYFGDEVFPKSLMRETFPAVKNQSAIFLVGSKEGECIDRAKRAFDVWEGKKKLVVIPTANHNLTNIHYLRRIKRILKP